jgi:hypothetical protein
MFELPPPDRIAELDATELMVLVMQLSALQSAAATRLLAAKLTPAPPPADGDGLLDVHAAAALIGRSVSWLRKRRSRQPGFSQPTGRGGRVRYSKALLLEWLASAQPC